jgi:hypothetical protein
VYFIYILAAASREISLLLLEVESSRAVAAFLCAPAITVSDMDDSAWLSAEDATLLELWKYTRGGDGGAPHRLRNTAGEHEALCAL